MFLLSIISIGVAGMKTGCSETQRQIWGVRIQVNYVTAKSKMLSIRRERERQGSRHKHFQLCRVDLAIFYLSRAFMPRRCFYDTETFPTTNGINNGHLLLTF